MDARSLETERTGIGRYLENLLREWTLSGPPRTFVLYVLGSGPPEGWMHHPPFVVRPIRFERPDQVDVFQAELERDPPDVFFAPLYDLPRPMPVPSVVTMHDLVHEACADGFNALQLGYLRDRHAWAAEQATRIITDSGFARREIADRYPRAEGRLVVIPLAADPRFASPPPGPADRPLHEPDDAGRNGPFVLYVGAITEKRHVPTLVDAFVASPRLREAGWRLVLVGRNYLREPESLDARVAHEQDRVTHHAHVGNDELWSLYRKAGLFVYPSTYEGFGMPPLEAMASGVPVISVPYASLPEVVGPAARMVEHPWEAEEMREALEEVALDPTLRRRLVDEGTRQARRFSWAETARRTLAVLDEVVDRA